MNNNSQPLVSIVIGAYNVERYISRTLDSVIAQTYEHIEIVIVNDGSGDATGNIIEAYSKKDNRIVVVTQTNQGVSAARNTGFRVAKGEYFSIFDADDIMMPTKIQSQVEFLVSNAHADLVYSNVYYFIDGAYDIYRHDLAIVSGPSVYKKLLQCGNFIYTSTVSFRRKIFDQHGGFDETLRSAEEFEYWLRLAQHGVKIVHQDQYLTLCRSRGNGLTSDSVMMYTTAREVFAKHLTSPISKLLSYQYRKISFLLYFSLLKRQKSQAGNRDGIITPQTSANIASRIFAFLKKVKYSLTFKKIHNQELQNFLISIESSSPYESTH